MIAPDVTLVNLTDRTLHVVTGLDQDGGIAFILRSSPVPGSHSMEPEGRLAFSSADNQVIAAIAGTVLRFTVKNATGRPLDCAKARNTDTNAPVFIFSAPRTETDPADE